MTTYPFRCFALLVWSILCFAPLRLCAAETDWDIAALDKILAGVQPGQNLVQVGDMQILVSNLTAWRDQLAGNPSLQSAFDGVASTWPGGNVYYNFSNSGSNAVPANLQKAFLDAAGEWATFANLHFILATTQSNYVTVQVDSGLEGGQSAVGMIGGQQFLSISPNAWNRGTLCHEIGHTLGLVHEHQRSDRNSFVTILTNNVVSGGIGNFVLLSNSRNQGAYDFLSVMHYARNYLSTATNLDTIEPLPAYTKFINLMGEPGPVLLSAGDRAGMAAIYGAGPSVSSVVTNTQDSGPGTLRTTLYYAYDHPGTRVTFNLATNQSGYTNGVFTIQPSDQLPSLVNATVLDGSSQPTNANSNSKGPSILINGALCPIPSTYANGLAFAGTNCIARALVINGFAASGILLSGTGTTGNNVSGCYLGIDPTGTMAVTNGLPPLTIQLGASGNTIGGIAASNRNIISGSLYQGLAILDPGTQSNVVEGNYFGLNALGTAALPNQSSGVAIYNGAQSNIIGSTVPGARNIISGNGLQGLTISDTNTTGNVVEGNYIGLNPAGTTAIPNTWSGVNLFGGAHGNTIGGMQPGAGNVISGNSIQGVSLQDSGTTNNFIQGNFIGLNAAGSAAIPNVDSGVEIFSGAGANVIGGGNVISGNGGDGVLFDNIASYNIIQGNFIGLDATGHTAIPNSGAGVEMFTGTYSNLVGGFGGPNFISGNDGDGVVMDNGASFNVVAGNIVGLDVTGNIAVPNAGNGVEMFLGANSNLVGGLGGRNFISGNSKSGVLIDDSSIGNTVQGNTIGLNISAAAAVPNFNAGVGLFGAAQSNLIGGTFPGAANLIAGNSGGGVELYDTTTTNNVIRGNSIYGNGGGGIYLYLANNSGSESAPILATAVVTTNTTISGSLISVASTTFHLDFYASPPPAYQAQASTYLGAKDVTTSAGGSVNFSTSVGATVPIGQIITATATDFSGNTSTLSAGVTVTGTDSVGDGITDAWRSAHFGGSGTTTNSSSCATCDPDHDGLNNLQEFYAGTNPNNHASALRLSMLTESGTNIIVGFQSVSGIVYRVDYKYDLSASGWSLFVDQILGTGSVIQLTDPGAAPLPKRFFRLDVLP